MIAESITAFVAVIDRLIQLVDRREKLNRNTFTDFVAPVMADLDIVHKDYIDSFKRYAALMADRCIPFTEDHPIFEEISRDILLSRNLRLKAEALMNKQALDPRLLFFAFSIEQYFDWTSQVRVQSTGIRGPFPDGPQARMELRDSLLGIATDPEHNDDLKYAEAARTSLDTIEELQNKYQMIFFEFSKLKDALLPAK